MEFHPTKHRLVDIQHRHCKILKNPDLRYCGIHGILH
ncbi:MAG TPA: hypothetical protein EYO01_01285 [Phycisphaerales bacterium]|nr:hypothetical protein [Phycisphaerales bacterium]HIB49832.1 hypothetical protein [Phycisphaerales bacterium]HIN83827.1 hypothetical protein [Phycisphaerales bacterium]HIO20646.1 hypothetical protein [Phycisphaerales bacterium]HIO52442.1 hypothetical protein [Phycisphaerales bacterium]